MSQSLYLRVRGRVLGPYDMDKLQELVQRGQLSRMHEVSEDGINWSRSTKYPELFASASAPPEAAMNNIPMTYAPPVSQTAVEVPATPVANTSQSQPVSDVPQRAGAASGAWHYAIGNQEHGPADFSHLQRLARMGQLSPSDQVWCEGMSEWVRADKVPNLVPVEESLKSSAKSKTINTKSNQEVSLASVRSLSRSRVWLIITAVMMFLYGAGSIFGALAMLANVYASGVFLVGALIYFAWGALPISAGVTLIRFSNRISDLQETKDPRDLDRALAASHSFWRLAGIVQLMLLLLIPALFFMLITVAAVGSSLNSKFDPVNTRLQ